MTTSSVGVVTIAHGRHDHLAAQHASLARGTRTPDRYVVVAMADARLAPADRSGLRREVLRIDAAPEGLPLAAARNLGARHLADVDVLIFLDVDCLAGRDLVTAYVQAVQADPGRVWSGPVTYLPPAPDGGYDLDRLVELDDPHPGRPAPAPGTVADQTDPGLFWSLSFALARPAWDRTGGFCEEYVGYGGEDTDFARVALRAGLGLAWVGSARAYHQFHPVSSPPVQHVRDIVRNARLFYRRWGAWPMLGWLEDFERAGLIERDTQGVPHLVGRR